MTTILIVNKVLHMTTFLIVKEGIKYDYNFNCIIVAIMFVLVA